MLATQMLTGQEESTHTSQRRIKNVLFSLLITDTEDGGALPV